MSLVTRAILELGNRCCLEQGVDLTLGRARDHGVDLHQLYQSPPSKRPYLSGTQNLDLTFLFHGYSSSTTLNVLALILPSGTARIYIVDPSPSRQGLAGLQDQYAKFWAERPTEETLYQPPKSLRFETTHHSNQTAALRALDRDLAGIESKPSLLVIASNKEQSFYDWNIPKLSKFPVMMMPGAKSAHSLDLLMWQKHVTTAIFSRFVNVGHWLHYMYEKASYFGIPLGNIEGDPALFCADLDFARRLIKNEMILWWSPLPKPDLGGMEEQYSFQEELLNPEVSNSGCFSNVSLRIDIHNLAVNSVLQSNLLNELEGSGGTTAFDLASHNLDEYSKAQATTSEQPAVTMGDSLMTTQVFAILRQMVKTWMVDSASDLQGPAALSVEHLWRWLCSTASNMHDPSLQRFVHGLMRKTFYQLLSEFRRLGSRIIHADFSSILLVTSKPPGAAYAYATYITSAVNSHELFQHVVLRTTTYYDFLLFMDSANFCAVVCENPDEPVDPSPDEPVALQTSFNIANFLPPAFQQTWLDCIRFFVAKMALIKRDINLTNGFLYALSTTLRKTWRLRRTRER